MKEPSPSEPSRQGYRWVVALGILAVLVAAFRYFNGQVHLRGALSWISNSGPIGMVAYVVLYIVACVLALPGTVLTVSAGTAFGLTKGVALTSVGATLGATAAFLVGRYVARGWVARRIENNARFKAIDQAVARDGWKIVGLTRLSPVFPGSLLNYAYGLTSVSLRDYFFASWIGMLPIIVVYVYLGSLVRDVADAADQPSHLRSPWEWALYGLGLLATLAVIIYVTRVARRALNQRVAEPSRQ